MQAAGLALLATLWVLGCAQPWVWPTFLYENDECRREGDRVWRCRKARHCAALRSLIRSNKVITCSLLDRRNPQICCPPSTPERITQRISEKKCQEYKEALCFQPLSYVEPSLRLSGRPPPMFLHSPNPVAELRAQADYISKAGEEAQTNRISEAGEEVQANRISEVGEEVQANRISEAGEVVQADWMSEAGEEAQDEDTTDKTPIVSVYGGDPAWAGEHPHMALLGFVPRGRILWWCGGSLISERYVLSAAHCADPRGLGKPQWVLLGAIDINDKSGPDSAMRQEFRIVEQHVHKDYRNTSYYNDIALFRLDRDAKFTWFVAPACLYQGLGEPADKAVVTGFGRNETQGPQMPVLQKATLKFVPNEVCKKKVKAISELPQGIQTTSQVCAWDAKKDTCQSDSGGPLVMATKDSCLARQVGITSFGPIACGLSDIPGTYVRVAYFLPWIESIVWPS